MRSPRFTPSASSRWLNCTASPRAIEDARERGIIPETTGSTADADEGTKAHAYAATALMTGTMPDIADADMAEAVTAYVEYCRSLVRPGDEMHVEKEVRLFYEHGSKGTTDFALTSHDRLVIGDYKNGVNSVEAVGNTQLLIYAGNFVAGMIADPATPVVLFIFQPNAIDKRVLREWTMTFGELSERLSVVRNTVVSIKAGQPGVFAPSPETCKYCPLAGVCAERARAALMPLDVVADDDVAGSLRLPGTGALSPDAVATVLRAAESIRAWLSAVEGFAHDRLNRGEVVPGYKLVTGQGNRKWVDEGDALITLETALGDEAFKKSVITPAAAEKLLKRKKSKVDLSTLLYRPQTAPKLVPDTHAGASIDAASDMPTV